MTAGWYSDPWAPGVLRWFDGAQWTPATLPQGAPRGSGVSGTGVLIAAVLLVIWVVGTIVFFGLV